MRGGFYAAAFFAAGSILIAGCGGSGGSDAAGGDAPSVEKPAIEKMAGTWVRTVSETMTDSGVDVGTRTTQTSLAFNSDGTFSQIDKIVRDYTEADGRTDDTTYRAFKGTVSASDVTVTCTFSGKVLDLTTEISDLSGVKWETYNVIKTFPAIIIEGKLYEENVFIRTGSGTGLLDEWTCEERKGVTEAGSSYGGEKTIYTFTDSGITGKMQSKDAVDGDWADDGSYSGTWTLTDETLLTITVGSMTNSFTVLVAGDYLIMGTEKGYSRK